MSRLLSLEWHKLVRSKAFYLWTLISAALSALFLIIPQLVTPITIDNGLASAVSTIVSSPICICFGFFICGFICLDFENGFLKNVISKGYKRSTVFASKYFITLISAVIMLIVNYLVVVAVEVGFFGAKIEISQAVIMQIVLMIMGLAAFCEIAYLLCVIFKKQGPVIGINIILILLVSTGISLLKTVVKIDFNISELWILDSVGAGTVGDTTMGLIVAGFVCTLVYFIGTYIATMYSVKKLEV